MSLILILFSIFTTNNSQADCSKFHNIKMIQTVDDTLHYEFIDQLRIAHKKIEELRNILGFMDFIFISYKK
ncbi:MAG: hypothetical protein M9962_11975 [Oligoflexia bacterium]|nr:hypothetical protein [Oligoflexia bacterium]